MKKQFKTWCYTAGLLIAACGLAAFTIGDDFTINGHITKMETGKAYLLDGTTNAVIDSVNITQGSFVFKGHVAEPMEYLIKFAGVDRQQVALFVENANITVNANRDSLYKAEIKGSATNDVWKDYLRDWKPVVTRAGEYYHLSDSVNKAHNNKPDSVAKAMVKADYAKVQAMDYAMHHDFIGKHPASAVGPYVILTHFITYFQFDEANKLFALLTPGAQNSYYGKQIKESIAVEKRSGIGAKPDFVMNDINGKPIKLSSLRGKYVLVDFWASWCAPCRRENPNVLANYKKYHDKGFEVVGVSLDKSKAAWLKAINDDGLVWTHVSDLKGWDNAAAHEFGIKVVPSNFLLDKDGKVIGKNLREEVLSNKLKSIFTN
jgi:thiol-disulfide isomerase/thioredoxin